MARLWSQLQLHEQGYGEFGPPELAVVLAGVVQGELSDAEVRSALNGSLDLTRLPGSGVVVVSVREKGARGNGLTDDLIAFNAAAAEALALHDPDIGKAVVTVAQGRYLLSATPTYDAGVVLWHAEPGASFTGAGAGFVAGELDPALGDVIARTGLSSEALLGAAGPGGESGIKLGTATHGILYRAGANALRTPGALTVDGALSASSLDAGSLQVTGTPLASTHLSDSALLARLTDLTGLDVGSHAADTTNVHGIVNTATLVSTPGSTGITTLGTIATGVWQGTLIDSAYIDQSLSVATLALSGTLSIGADTNLYRSGANVLRTDDAMVAAAGFSLDAGLATAAFRAGQVAANVLIQNNLLVADANAAFRVLGDGKHEWGPGGASGLDTNLYRSAANVLKTDDTFNAAGLQVAGTALASTHLSDGAVLLRGTDVPGGDLSTTYAVPTVDAELGAGSDNPWTITNGSAQMTAPYLLPRSNVAGTQLRGHRYIRSTDQTAGNKRLSLFWLTRDTGNWQPGSSFVVEVFSTYPVGGYTKSIVGGAYGTALALECVESYGAHPLRPTLTAEATITGNWKEAHCYVDLPEYHGVVVKITYGHRYEEARPFSSLVSGRGYMEWTPGLTTAGSGQAIDKKTVGLAQLLAEVLAGGWGIVLTGGVVGTARPTTGYGQYIWLHDGATAPTNMANGDLWFDPDP